MCYALYQACIITYFHSKKRNCTLVRDKIKKQISMLDIISGAVACDSPFAMSKRVFQFSKFPLISFRFILGKRHIIHLVTKNHAGRSIPCNLDMN